MRIQLKELKYLIKRALNEKREFYDVFFIEDIIPDLKRRGLLPKGIGNVIGYGNEAIIFSFGPDKVIRLHPTYEMSSEQAEKVFQRMKTSPSGGLYVNIFDVGKIEGFDKEFGKVITYAVYTIMERLSPLNNDEAQIIDDVLTNHELLTQVESTVLKSFLQKYLSQWRDYDSSNIMKRGDDYVIIDPE